MKNKNLFIIAIVLLLLTLMFDYYANQVMLLKSQVTTLENKLSNLSIRHDVLQSDLNQTNVALENRINNLDAELQRIYSVHSKLTALEFTLRTLPENKLPLFFGPPFAHFKCNDTVNSL